MVRSNRAKRPNNSSLLLALYNQTDPGYVITSLVRHLLNNLTTTKLVPIRTGGAYIDSLSPPIAEISNGYVDSPYYPEIGLHLWESDRIPKRELIISQGPEPHTKWENCAKEIFAACRKYGISRAFSVEGRYAPVPHTRAPSIMSVVNSDYKKSSLGEMGLVPEDREGQLSFQDLFTRIAIGYGIRHIGLKIEVPEYLEGLDYPYINGCWMALHVVEKLLECDLKSDLLRQRADIVDDEMNVYIKKDPEMSIRVAELERRYDNDSIINKISGDARMQSKADQN